ncbi:MAG: hypothetical protein RJQ21_15650, partial [Rhodospirillales bacterium]
VAAAFGPPAALWLIIGYVQLGSAIRENNFALKQLHWQTKRAADQAEVEARTLVESRSSAKRAELFPLISYLIDELNPLVAHLAVELKLIDNAQYSSAWQRFGQGDRWVFFRCILNTSGGLDSLQRKVAQTLKHDPKALALAEEFRENYANLVNELRDVEGDGLITRLVEGGNLGRLDTLLKRTIPIAEPAPATVPEPKPEPEPEAAEIDPVPAGGWTSAVEKPLPAHTKPFPVETRTAPPRETAPAPTAIRPETVPEPEPVPEPATVEELPEPELPRDPQRDEARRALAEIAAALQAVDRVNEEADSDAQDELASRPSSSSAGPRLDPVFSSPRPVDRDSEQAFRPRSAPPQRPLQAAQTLPREGSPFPTVNLGSSRDAERRPAIPESEAGDPAPAAESATREPLPPIPEGIRPKDEPKRRLSPIVAGLFGNRPKDG